MRLLFTLMLWSVVCPAQQVSDATVLKDTTHVNWLRFGCFVGLGGGALLYSQIKQTSMYWNDPSPFYMNTKDDWKYAHGADKFGHVMAANLICVGVREGLVWSGVDSMTALWSGFGFAIFHQTAIEIRDGFSRGRNGTFAPYLGFSWGDMTANVLGASFPVLQHYSGFAANLRYKYSLNPSQKIKQGGYYTTLLADYESEYHWLSFNVYELLPKSAQSYWTPILSIAVGHSVKDIVDYPGHYTYSGFHELWLSLDYNLEALPGDAQWWKSFKKILNFYKLPAPCVRILPSVVWYGLRF